MGNRIDEMVKEVIDDLNLGRESEVRLKIRNSINKIIEQQRIIASAESKMAEERIVLKAIQEAEKVDVIGIIGS
jgi:hypothetical protein